METRLDDIEARAGVQAYVDMFQEAEYSSYDERNTAHRCRDYVDGNQLTAEEIAELEKRGQPVVVINRIRRKINWLRGIEVQKRTDPKAFARSPDAQYDADAATLGIRYVCDNAKWNRKKSKVWEDMLVEGVGGVEVVHKFQPPMREPEIVINRYQYDRLFWDPHSSETDFSDARYLGAVIWSDLKELQAQYPDKEELIEASMGPVETTQDTFEDKPHFNVWSDPKRRRARCVLLYHKKNGVWHWVKFVKGGILEEGQSPYVDDVGMSICPMIIQSTYVSRENERYGEVKDMLDPQDEINKRRSKFLHQLSQRQTWGIKGAVESVSKMKRELSKADGHIEIEQEAVLASAESGIAPFNIISQTDQVQGQAALLADAKAEIDLLGANSALQGQGEASSGREVLARQQGGMIEITPAQDELANFTVRVYRHVWYAIRQFWTEQKWVRVTDDPRNVRFVTLNRPVPLREHLEQLPREQVVQFAYQNQMVPDDPRLQMPVGVENNVAEMDVDILLEEVEDSITLEGETFEQLVNLASSMPGTVPPEILVEASPLQKNIKDRLIERMEQQAAAAQQQQQAQMQMGMQRHQAEVQEIEAGAMEDMAQARKHLMEAAFNPAAGE